MLLSLAYRLVRCMFGLLAVLARPHQPRQQRPPDIETQPAYGVADLRSARRKPPVAGLINEYHHAA